MLPLEHHHLKHVLQTVSALETAILRSFGPEGGQVLFTRDTGRAMLSRSGTRILTALHLENPLARMVVECVWKHSTVAGDGSKTFILLLASLLRMIHTTASKELNVSRSYTTQTAEAATASCLAEKLLAFALTELDELIAANVVPYGFCISLKDFTDRTHLLSPSSNEHCQKLLSSFFHTRIDYAHCDFISDLMCELLNHWRVKNNGPCIWLQFLNNNFPSLHTPVSGFPITSSRLIEGQVIHRDFATPCPQIKKQPVKAVIFTGYLQPKLLNPEEVLQLGCGDGVTEDRSIVHFSARMERSLEGILAKLQSFGVSVLLSAVKQSAAALALATHAEMCLVECVNEEELSLFAELSGATPISECSVIQPKHVATLTFCQPILLGAQRYVHVGFYNSEDNAMVKPCGLVICAPGEGQTDQYVCAFQDAVRMLLTIWEPVHKNETESKRDLQAHNCAPKVHKDSLSESTTAKPSSMHHLQKSVIEPGFVIPAGGTFEFLLHHALLQHGRSCSPSNHTNAGVPVSQLLAHSLLSIPRRIYSHSPKLFLQTQTRVLSFTTQHFHPFIPVLEQGHNAQSPVQTESPREDDKESWHCCRKTDLSSKVFMLDLGLESVSCKYKLLLAVMQCAATILRVDMRLHTHTALHTQSRRLTNTSWNITEDEAED
ncbi:Bardet-Biedl syndrome 10 protein [Cololabis saira]|uniref:Bardet-Biedl syndrome 10 protein n=1 Tax=Cololabis saira TaxID=129043 RepID=UPI002AD416B6|nr:Bardet-Biedl syndrome 10 protein [Cololabis saira]XP_061577909.1 Bardet-Biedl syndrome 10 protein [Cololabis saira]XP_061577910.1 Bardet-Biedl syndrome 10 protein [Cololabis saira]XP_061577911.1 Bardet-Biedl syndrome 10 protein [Cololabis saira]